MMTMAEAAADAYFASMPGARPVALIEVGYVDLRDPGAVDRVLHTQDSLRLFDRLQTTSNPPTILRSLLVNDFAKDTYCGAEMCGWADARTPPTAPLLAWAGVPVGNGAESEVRVYGMRNIRNRAAKHLDRLLRRSRQNPLIVRPDGDLTDIFADTEDGRIFLGCRRHAPGGVSVRCTALMAQHYYDLYLYAAEANPGMSDLWVFDFNRAIEGDRVWSGARASMSIYPWPTGVRTWVVNCIDYPDRPDLPPLRFTTRA